MSKRSKPRTANLSCAPRLPRHHRRPHRFILIFSPKAYQYGNEEKKLHTAKEWKEVPRGSQLIQIWTSR